MSIREARNRGPQLPTLDVINPTWQEDAACAGVDGIWHVPGEDDFSPPGERARRERQAKALCHRCPVKAECLDWAFEVEDWWAVLGGTTGDERRQIARRRKRKART